MRPVNIPAIRIKRTTLVEWLVNFCIAPLTPASLRTIGSRMTRNDKMRNHMKPKRTTGKPSRRILPFTSSRMRKGSIRTELIIAGGLELPRRMHSLS